MWLGGGAFLVGMWHRRSHVLLRASHLDAFLSLVGVVHFGPLVKVVPGFSTLSYCLFSLQLIGNPWGDTEIIQISCTSFKFPLGLGIH